MIIAISNDALSSGFYVRRAEPSAPIQQLRSEGPGATVRVQLSPSARDAQWRSRGFNGMMPIRIAKRGGKCHGWLKAVSMLKCRMIELEALKSVDDEASR